MRITEQIYNVVNQNYLCIAKKDTSSVDTFELRNVQGQMVYTGSDLYYECFVEKDENLIVVYDSDVYKVWRSSVSNTQLQTASMIINAFTSYAEEVKKKLKQLSDEISTKEPLTDEELQEMLFVTYNTVDEKLQLAKVDIGRLFDLSGVAESSTSFQEQLNLLADLVCKNSEAITNLAQPLIVSFSSSESGSYIYPMIGYDDEGYSEGMIATWITMVSDGLWGNSATNYLMKATPVVMPSLMIGQSVRYIFINPNENNKGGIVFRVPQDGTYVVKGALTTFICPKEIETTITDTQLQAKLIELGNLGYGYVFNSPIDVALRSYNDGIYNMRAN